MTGRGTVCGLLLASCLLGLSLRAASLAFTPSGPAGAAEAATGAPASRTQRAAAELAPALEEWAAVGVATAAGSPWQAAVRLVSGIALGALLLTASVGPARADLDDVAIPVDGKGKTVNLTREEILRGKRLFNAACATCHVGGGTRTNQNVGLGYEELSGAQPTRNTVDGLVDYLNSPTTYDGLKDISEVHPSIRGADLWPKMRSMKQKDLYDISAYILYQNFTIPEKWGGGKQYY
mmetsp:Transcript_94658/g.263312  ORF Transcript_94658/g.263312 Transcript_94658/m.263312 type:complete len:236 (+) Transcript_94658:41-748(+)